MQFLLLELIVLLVLCVRRTCTSFLMLLLLLHQVSLLLAVLIVFAALLMTRVKHVCYFGISVESKRDLIVAIVLRGLVWLRCQAAGEVLVVLCTVLQVLVVILLRLQRV